MAPIENVAPKINKMAPIQNVAPKINKMAPIQNLDPKINRMAPIQNVAPNINKMAPKTNNKMAPIRKLKRPRKFLHALHDLNHFDLQYGVELWMGF